jgi:predicted Zn-dependent peptidase
MTTHHFFKLPSGETVCVAAMPWTESVNLGVWAGVGGRHDAPAHGGLAHFVEHMIFKGTKRRSARRVNIDVESVGGSMDAYTSEDHTAFFVRGPAEHFPRFADVLFDIYQNSTFDAADVTKEREVIAEEISMYKEQPQQLVEDLLWRTAWANHPLGRPIAGTEETLQAITSRALRDHARRWFGRSNTIISVAGRVEPDEVRRVLTAVLGKRGLPREGERPPVEKTAAPRPRRRQPQVGVVTRDIEQVQLALAFHTPGRLSPMNPTLRLLNVLLGENTSSRLWSELREARGLCYDVSSDLTGLHETGLLHIFAGVDPLMLERSLRVIGRELRQLATRPVSARALHAAAAYAVGTSRMALENPSSQMTAMAECHLFYGRYVEPEAYHERLRGVTALDIQALAKRLFVPGNLATAFVGPDLKAASLAKVLTASLA